MAFQCLVSLWVGIDNYVAVFQLLAEFGKVDQSFLMHNDAIQCVAYADSARLGIVDNICSFLYLSEFVKVSVANTCSCLNDRYFGIIAYKID